MGRAQADRRRGGRPTAPGSPSPTPLGSVDPPALAAEVGHRIFAFRGRASLFGWNAPHPNVLAEGDPRPLRHRRRPRLDLRLSSRQPGRSWTACRTAGSPARSSRSRGPATSSSIVIAAAVDDGVANYAVSGARHAARPSTATRTSTTFEAAYRRVSAYGKSEELAFAETPIVDAGDGRRAGAGRPGRRPAEGRQLIVRGRLRPGAGAGRRPRARRRRTRRMCSTLRRAASPCVAAPRQVCARLGQLWMAPARARRIRGRRERAPGQLRVRRGQATAEIAAETAVLASVSLADDTHAELNLAGPARARLRPRHRADPRQRRRRRPMARPRRRSSATATPAAPFQTFQLKQAPLTYVSAATETGAASTLELRVDDVAVARGARRSTAARPASGCSRPARPTRARPIVQFGDGVSGARPRVRPQQHRRQLPQGDRPRRLREGRAP